jgi:hypothetical protein
VIIYGAVPFAFIVKSPQHHISAGFLLWGIVACGSAFLAFGIGAARCNMQTAARGSKTIYAVGGLAEGTETIVALSAMLLFPAHFDVIAVVFGALCWATAAARVLMIMAAFREPAGATCAPLRPLVGVVLLTCTVLLLAPAAGPLRSERVALAVGDTPARLAAARGQRLAYAYAGGTGALRRCSEAAALHPATECVVLHTLATQSHEPDSLSDK